MIFTGKKHNPKPIHTSELNGHNFVFACDVEYMKKWIEFLRNHFDD